MAASTLSRRRLGKDGPQVTAMGLGLMGLSGSYGTKQDDEERFKFMDRAVELGMTFWDTSDLYGDNEELIGRWFKRTGKRDEIFLASKFGFVMTEPGVYHNVNSTGEYAKEACNKALKTLGVEYIDLYYLHHANKETPIEDTMRGLAELKAEGKIKHIGLSNIGAKTLRRAVKIAPVAAVQIEYSLFQREVEGERSGHFLATCRELGVSVVCYSPLGRGILTGAYSTADALSDPKDPRAKAMPWFHDENRATNAAVVDGIAALAAKRGCTTTQLALAWLLAQGDDVIPIPGTRRAERLEENLGALKVQLTKEDEQEIRSFVENAKLAGGSRPEAYDYMAYGETKEEGA